MTQALDPATEAATDVGATHRRAWQDVLFKVMPSLVPTVVMLAIGRWRLGNPSLGRDEAATLSVSQRTPDEIITLAHHVDGVIAPYYFVMHLWTVVFGDSVQSLRMPSVIAIAVGVGLFSELGRRLFDAKTGLLAGLMLTLVPLMSRYALEARVYGIVFMLAALTCLTFYHALQQPSWRRWIYYGLCVVMLGLAHMLALLLLGGHLFVILSRWYRTRQAGLTRWFIVTAISVLPALPLAWLGLHQRDAQLNWIAPMTTDIAREAPDSLFGAAAVAYLFIGLAFALRTGASERPIAIELLVAAVIPPAALIAYSFTGTPMWVPRYVLFALGFVALLAAAALRGLRYRPVAVLVVLAIIAYPALDDVRRPNSHQGPNLRHLASVISANYRPGDGIIYGTTSNWSLRIGIDYYLRGKPAPVDLLSVKSGADAGTLGATECTDPACIGTTQRVWLLRHLQSDNPLSDAGAVEPYMREHYREVVRWKVSKATLVLYERVTTG